jgi:hypothetical protein
MLAHSFESNIWADRKKIQLASLPSHPPSFKPTTTDILRKMPQIEAKVGQLNKNQINKKQKIGLFTALPLNFGSIKDFTPTADKLAPTILHIQDVHRNFEAQTNINNTLQNLIKTEKIDLIALEGAFEPLDLSLFKNFPQPETVTSSAKYLFEKGSISGAMNAILATKVPINVIGVDDSLHYHKNVTAYKQSTSQFEKAQKILRDEKIRLNEKKNLKFNAQLRSFDGLVQNYHDGQLGMGEFIQRLASHEKTWQAQTQLFLEALRLENKINFDHVQKERTTILSNLIPTLDPATLNNFYEEAIRFQMGVLTQDEFYSTLKNLCDRSGISLTQYPAMQSYIQYVLLSSQIDGDKLFKEISSLENNSYHRLHHNRKRKNYKLPLCPLV